MSLRSRGENPYAVALRRNVGEKLSSASSANVAFGPDLRLAVWRDRIERGLLVNPSLA